MHSKLALNMMELSKVDVSVTTERSTAILSFFQWFNNLAILNPYNT